MQPLGERVKVTHEVVADIKADAVAFFEKEVWPHMQNGLPVSVSNIASIVESD